MTVIESATFDAAAAERRAERIRLRLDAIADNYTAVLPMIRQAIEMRDDVALGYRSVGDYVSDRFGGALTNLGIEVRREVVRELTSAGMSTRAIAPVVGADFTTVYRDQKATGVAHATPSPAIDPETGEVGPDYPEPTPTAGVQTAATEGAPGGRVERDQGAPSAPAPLPPVTGRDGKTYTRPEPTTPKRRPLTDAFWTAAYDLGKKAEALHRLTEDDRFPQNAEKVAATNRNDLIRSRDLLQQVIESLPAEEATNV